MHASISRTQPRLRQTMLAISLLTLLTGCTTVGPDYRPPTLDVPANWIEADTIMSDSDHNDLRTWWRAFQDPLLDHLVEQTLSHNKDLDIALVRLRQARAEREQIVAAAMPEISVEASSEAMHGSKAFSAKPGGQARTWHLGFEASWELDLFGGTRRAVEAADAGIQALTEDHRALQVSMVAALVSDYAGLRASQLRLTIARDNIRSLAEAERLAERAHRIGLGTLADVTQARAEREMAESQPPLLEADIARFNHAIGVLTGGFPGNWHAPLASPAPVLSMSAKFPLSLPSTVIRQRPDLRADERRLAAATAQIGAAEAERFPTFRIPLGFGTAASVIHDLFSGASLAWSAAMQGSQSLYDAGRVRASVTAAEANAEAVRRVYERDVRSAMRDVEDALTAWTSEHQRQTVLEKAVADSQQALQQATQLYARGLSAYMPVLVSQRSLNQARDALAISQLAQLQGGIALYKALGAGWSDTALTSESDQRTAAETATAQ